MHKTIVDPVSYNIHMLIHMQTEKPQTKPPWLTLCCLCCLCSTFCCRTALLHLVCCDKNILALSGLIDSQWASALDFTTRDAAMRNCIELSAERVSQNPGDLEQSLSNDVLKVCCFLCGVYEQCGKC